MNGWGKQKLGKQVLVTSFGFCFFIGGCKRTVGQDGWTASLGTFDWEIWSSLHIPSFGSFLGTVRIEVSCDQSQAQFLRPTDNLCLVYWWGCP